MAALSPDIEITHVAIVFKGILWSLPRPNRHHHIIRMIADDMRESERNESIREPVFGEQGFLLRNGTFVDRRKGAIVAINNEQIKELKFNKSQLFSEDLW